MNVKLAFGICGAVRRRLEDCIGSCVLILFVRLNALNVKYLGLFEMANVFLVKVSLNCSMSKNNKGAKAARG